VWGFGLRMLRMSSPSRRFAPFLIDFGDMCGEIVEKAQLFLPYTELLISGLRPGRQSRSGRNPEISSAVQNLNSKKWPQPLF